MDKLFIFGIDGGSLKLIEKWRDVLPNLKRIMENGVWGELESTFPPVTCPAWPAMFTGKNPAKLGMYDFLKYESDREQTFGLNTSLDYSSSAIWKILNNHGKKVGLLNVATTFPPQKIDGFLVCGIGSPALDAMKTNYTYPPELKKTLDEVVGGYEIIPLLEMRLPNIEEQCIRAFDELLEKREKAASYLLANTPWDLFVCVFFALDPIQHYFWHHMDESHTRPGDAKYRDVIKNYYIKVDGAIGRLLEQIPEGTNILVVSDHGFGPIHNWFVVNRWLENNGFLKFKEKIRLSKTNNILRQTRNFLMAYLPPNLTRLVAKLLPRAVTRKLADLKAEKEDMISVYRNIDWPQTKAYGIGKVGMIYINLKGREPGGIVEPGREYEAVRDEIIAKLKKVIDPETGKPVTIQVFKKEELYQGQYFESAPDILYIMEKYYQTNSIRYKSEWGQPAFSGWHVREGIFIAYGPDIRPGGEKLDGLRIYDIAPTILHMFGLAVPSDMDGRVLVEIFKEDSKLAQKEVIYQEVDLESERIKSTIRELKRLGRL